MTVAIARRWLVFASLLVTGVTFVFFLVAPAVGYPLTWEQSIRVFEIVIPVFLGYLGTATHFLFHTGGEQQLVRINSSGLLSLIVRGPLIVFVVVGVAIVFAFGYANRAAATPGEGMSVDALSYSFTALMGLLAVTTNVAVSYLFALGEKAASRGSGPESARI